MSRERRISPRKDCAVPLHFRIASNGAKGVGTDVTATDEGRASKSTTSSGVLDGEAINLSERGIYFRSRQPVTVGDPLEMYLTLPRELTGRESEQVRCSARVVHVDQGTDQKGRIGVGASVERFESLVATRNWGN
jgi:hypothetical protein